MKIKEYLQDVYDLILEEEARLNELERMPAMHFQNLNRALDFLAQKVEIARTIRKLKSRIDSRGEFEVSSARVKCFQTFLSERWWIIIDSDLAYNYNFEYPANKICLLLATKIAPILYLHRYEILMPSIATFNAISLTSILEDEVDADGNEVAEAQKLQLNQFILCDNNKYIINVFDAITYALYDNKNLKHTSALEVEDKRGVKTNLLNAEEATRVISHSQYALEYYTAVNQLVDALKACPTIGSAVKRLIERLREGGSTRTGQSMFALPQSNSIEGTVEFYEYLNLLTPEEKHYLFSCSAPDTNFGPTFEEVWIKLAYRAYLEKALPNVSEEEVSYMATVVIGSAKVVQDDQGDIVKDIPLCVELAANDLEDILDRSDLMQRFAQNVKAANIGVEQSQERVDIAQINFITALKSGSYFINSPYIHNQKYASALVKRIFRSLNALQFSGALDSIDFHYHEEIVKIVMMKTALRNLIRTVDDLAALLEIKYKPTQKVIICTLEYKYLLSKLTTAAHLKKILVLLDPNYLNEFLENLGRAHILSLIANEESKSDFFVNLPTAISEVFRRNGYVEQDYVARPACARRLLSFVGLFAESAGNVTNSLKSKRDARDELTDDDMCIEKSDDDSLSPKKIRVV